MESMETLEVQTNPINGDIFPPLNRFDASLMETAERFCIDPTKFRPTDAGNALLFTALFKQDVRYIEAHGQWIVWRDGRWIVTSDTALLPFARGVTEYMFEYAASLGDEQRTALRKHALASQREQRLRAMVNLAKAEASLQVRADQLDANPWLLGCPNGTLDLRTGQHRSPERDDYITKSTGIAYNPTADAPNFMQFLKTITDGDQETIEHLQRIAGYILTGSVSDEVMLSFFGSGSNGKTTFAMALYRMMGDYAGKARKDLLLQSQGQNGSASPDVAALQGKRLILVSETDDGGVLAEAQVKEITSNEPITARGLYKDLVTFMPTHKTLLLTNHRPLVKGTDDGIWRRLNIVGFDHKFKDEERDAAFFETKLLPELAGVLAWAAQGAQKWACDGGLKPSKAVQDAKNAYRSQMDFIGLWLDDRCTHDSEASTNRTTVYNDYCGWADTEHYPKLGPHKFFGELGSRGFTQAKSKGQRNLRGLKLKTPSQLYPKGLMQCLPGPQ